MAKEFWTIRNIPSRFGCYARGLKTAKNIAKQRGIPLILEHHGPRQNPNHDRTRVNQVINSDGTVVINEQGGVYIDA